MSASKLSPIPPQTAADLLEGVLRSCLFAESILGQIVEQSQPYLQLPASMFAETLVNKRVLTPWQSRRLLRGHTDFYAGTFRILERLTTSSGASLFVAEQSSPQRLVLLKVSPPSRECHLDRPAVQRDHRRNTPQSQIARSIDVQQTEQMRMVAYEFLDALPLSALLTLKTPEPAHKADLLRQFSQVVQSVNDDTLDTIRTETTLLDSQGTLILLSEPDCIKSLIGDTPASSDRIDREMLAIQRFASQLGGVPEWEGCHSPGEVGHCLEEIAQPWRDVFSIESMRCPRSLMNRYLRKGPALRSIDAFATEKQVILKHLKQSEQFQSLPASTTDGSALTPEREQMPLEPSLKTTPPIRSERRQGGVSGRSGRLPPKRNITLIAALVGGAIAGLTIAQWILHWQTQQAEATTELPADQGPPPGTQ